MHDIILLKLFLFRLEFNLFVDQFLSQDSLLDIQVQEDGEVFVKFVVLLLLDDPLDLSLLCNFILNTVHLVQFFDIRLSQECLLLLPVHLSLNVLCLPDLLLH